MISFIGNCSDIINWTDVINGLEQCDYERHPGPDNGPTHKEGDPIPLLHQVTDIWRDEGYKIVELGGTIQWDMFFPGKHYDRIVEEKFCDFFEIKPGIFTPRLMICIISENKDLRYFPVFQTLLRPQDFSSEKHLFRFL